MPTPVGRTASTQSSGTSFTWARTCAVGNTLVLFVQHAVTATTVTVTDSASNTWAKVKSTNDLSATSQRNIDVWVCVPTTAVTSVVMTASATTSWVVSAEDFAGAKTVRDSNSYFGSGHTLPSFTAGAGDILLLCAAYVATTAGTAQLALTGWTYEALANLTTTQQETWQIPSATAGTVTPVFTTNPTIGAVYLSLAAPAGANNPPTITGPGIVNVTTSTGSLTFTGNDTDGTISSFACVNQSNTATTTVTPTIGTGVVTGAGTANASVTFPVSGMTANAKYFFGGTATDNAGATSATSSATINVTSNTPGYRAVTSANHAVVGGGTALAALQAATPSTRYLESPAPPAGASDSITYQPLQASSVPKVFNVVARAKNADSVIAITVTLKMNDTTTIATRGPFNLTLTDATYGGTTNPTETALITDSSKLSTYWSET